MQDVEAGVVGVRGGRRGRGVGHGGAGPLAGDGSRVGGEGGGDGDGGPDCRVGGSATVTVPSIATACSVGRRCETHRWNRARQQAAGGAFRRLLTRAVPSRWLALSRRSSFYEERAPRAGLRRARGGGSGRRHALLRAPGWTARRQWPEAPNGAYPVGTRRFGRRKWLLPGGYMAFRDPKWRLPGGYMPFRDPKSHLPGGYMAFRLPKCHLPGRVALMASRRHRDRRGDNIAKV